MKEIGSLIILDSWPKPWNVRDYYHIAQELLKFGAGDAELSPDSPFYGKTPDEIERFRDELEKQAVLLLAASYEAVFRIDLALRAKRRHKQSKSLLQHFRYRRFKDVRFEEILDAWKKELRGHEKEVIGNFKQVVNYRHWLAHGRYWDQTSGLTVIDVEEVFSRGNAALKVVPIFPDVDYAPPVRLGGVIG